ncbi:MAG TPA: MaoC/PaaZ C-terminal domain-containing protein [Candidatus Hydrogenedentes bacterium]|nr:MaoC/PaaZ C-terminal domain-containing protein [Candidatus Hydrogenedentota bacterium]HPG65928.1 MaoC/PaaZ C-terminal domain-containing protein [Candidatus Hydrogenedentota bacterium]
MSDVVLFEREPSMARLYVRAFAPRLQHRGHSRQLPRLGAERRNVLIAPDKLSAYRRICHLDDDGVLPLMYPQVLAFGLQLALLAHPAFPLAPMGIIHQRNHVLGHRPVGVQESVDLRCLIGETRVVKSGLEFDVTTVMMVGGEGVWEGVSVYLSRGAYGEADAPSPLSQMEELGAVDHESSWRVAPDTGRRYARISGDLNPIHLATPLAWLFGFRRAIAHGMWCASRCLTELPSLPKGHALRYDVAFKGPVFAGKSVVLKAATSKDRHRFDLFCAGNPRPVIKGALRSEPSSAALMS